MYKKVSMIFAGLAVAATTAFAASHAGPNDAAIGARQAHMKLYAFNLGVLGGMARGKMDYDADAASTAANNLAALASMSQMGYWPQGSDNSVNDKTRALPVLWTDFAGAAKFGNDLAMASKNLASVAGNGLEALQGAMGPVGGACGGCHKAYRAPDN